MMTATEQRQRFRAILAGAECKSPASVFDGLSARIARSVGYELGILAGSVASNTTLAAPDLIVLTLTEFADQIRRIQRASDLSLIVDADHGYGNAVFALGAGVRGGQFYSRWPGLSAGKQIDGDLAVTTDYRSVLTEVLRARFPSLNTSRVFPGTAYSPLGFMR